MTYSSVTEIFGAIDGVRARLRERVEGLDAERERYRPEPGVWSVAEIVEHLSIIEGQLAHLLGKLVGRAEAEGQLRPRPEDPLAPVSIARHTERAATSKFEAPEAARPTGSLGLGEGLARLAQSRAALHELRPRLERVDGTRQTFPHPVFGPLDLYQWLLFVGAHEERHLRQVERLLEGK